MASWEALPASPCSFSVNIVSLLPPICQRNRANKHKNILMRLPREVHGASDIGEAVISRICRHGVWVYLCRVRNKMSHSYLTREEAGTKSPRQVARHQKRAGERDEREGGREGEREREEE